MRRPRQYQRRLKLVYGAPGGIGLGSGPSIPFTINSYAGSGHRVSFVVERSNRYVPDKAYIDIYNLRENVRDALKSDLEDQWVRRREVQAEILDIKDRAKKLKAISDSYRVNLFVGYGDNDAGLVLLMRGDLINVVPNVKRGGNDTITRIELGDTLLAMRDAYLRTSFGTGATITNILRFASEAAGLSFGEGTEKLIGIVAPNATITKTEGGYVAVGRVGDTISELADLLGLQWWVTDGVLHMVPQGATLQDFSIQLREGRDLLDFVESNSYDDVKGKALLNPDIVPGRGLILQDKAGVNLDLFGYRVNSTKYRGDTRGSQWFVEFEATNISNSLLAPAIEFRNEDIDAADQLAILERNFG